MQRGIKSFRLDQGWTLIEVTVVVLLLGVLIVAAVPRFSGSDGYQEHTYRARLISSLRTMQQRAMQDSRAGFCYQVNVVAGANSGFGPPTINYLDDSPANQTVSCSQQIDTSANAEYLTTTGNEMAQAGVVIVGANRTIRFNKMGCTVDGGNVCTTRYRIEIQGQNSRAVCVESQGYIHACD